MNFAKARPLVPLIAPLALIGTAVARADSKFFAELPGKHVDQAMAGLAERGYHSIGKENEHGETLHYLWNGRLRDCEVLAARDGRVRNVSAVSPAVCEGMDRGGNGKHAGGRHEDNYAHGAAPLPREITGLVGNKRDDAEDKLERQGFEKLEGGKSHGHTSSLWWNRSRGECLSVEAKDGKVQNIQREPRNSCD